MKEMGAGMYLNLITPLFRSGMLSKIKASIPQQPDINWIIVLCDSRQILKEECESLGLKYLTIPDPEELSSLCIKTNKAIDNMKPGFFQAIDDDTLFHPNSYVLFQKLKHGYSMIMGDQVLSDGSIRPAQKPKHCYTDGAQALISTDLLKDIRIGDFTLDPVADCNFLLSAWNKCPENKRLIVNEPISFYNALR